MYQERSKEVAVAAYLELGIAVFPTGISALATLVVDESFLLCCVPGQVEDVW